jgi:hypothetical protein
MPKFPRPEEHAWETLHGGGPGFKLLVANGYRGILPAYQSAFEELQGQGPGIIAHLHDDFVLRDKEWVSKVLEEFRDPTVGLAGFGGALEHGTPELYQAPYDYLQLGRGHFLSNMEDAEVHGRRFTGTADVAVLDGYSLIIRKEILERAGGWPVQTPLGYVGYDYWASAITRRQGFRIRVLGIPCKHFGAATFGKLGKGADVEQTQEYQDAYRYIYDTCRDVLPFRVSP